MSARLTTADTGAPPTDVIDGHVGLGRLAGYGVLAILAAGLLAALVGGLTLGRFPIPAARLLEIFVVTIGDPARPIGGMDERIALLVRLPRVLMAALAGAGLAVAGAALQGVFRNPLVAPQILGISPGAAFGGALAIRQILGGSTASRLGGSRPRTRL